MCRAGKLDNLQLTKVGINSKMYLNINCTCLKILPPYIAGKRSHVVFTIYKNSRSLISITPGLPDFTLIP